MSIHLYDLLTFLLVILFVLGFVTIVMWFKKKEGERKTNLMLSALDKGQTIDPELFRSGKLTKKNILLTLLISGTGVSLFAAMISIMVIIGEFSHGTINENGTIASALLIAIGASLLLGYFKGKKML